MEKDLAGKVFLVTGGTEGIGKAAARDFAARGATLMLVGRNPVKTAGVVEELRRHSGNPHVESIAADLSKLADVRAAAEQFKARHPRLDVLVNNAGAVFAGFHLSPDGFELTFAVNHLAYFQLTVALLDVLRATPGARVVSTSSGAHRTGRMDIPDIASPKNRKAGFKAYSDSKLANILFTRELARRLEGSGVTANVFHPGFIRSNFAMNNGAWARAAVKAASALFAKTPEQGADTLIWLATSPEAARFNGEYFYRRRVEPTTALAKDPELARALWTFSEELLRRAEA